LPDEGEELLPGFLLVTEAAEHGRSDCCRVLLLNAAHHHAEMPRLDNHADTLRLDDLLDRLGALRRQTLLNVEYARTDFKQPWNFAQAYDFAGRNVRVVHFTEVR